MEGQKWTTLHCVLRENNKSDSSCNTPLQLTYNTIRVFHECCPSTTHFLPEVDFSDFLETLRVWLAQKQETRSCLFNTDIAHVDTILASNTLHIRSSLGSKEYLSILSSWLCTYFDLAGESGIWPWAQHQIGIRIWIRYPKKKRQEENVLFLRFSSRSLHTVILGSQRATAPFSFFNAILNAQRSSARYFAPIIWLYVLDP